MIPEFLRNLRELFGTEARDAAVMARVAEEQRKRLAAMATDPIRQPYVMRIEAGEHWQDADITFNIDPTATNVCEHLRPIEQLMRRSKIDLRIATVQRILANCLVNFDKLTLAMKFAPSVAYIEPHIPDRSMLDPHSAIIICKTCESGIFAVHADSATAATPWFPS